MGKAISSRNGIRHGFFAHSALIPGESAEEYAVFRDSILASIDPEGPLEAVMTGNLIDAAWQMRRYPAATAAIITTEMYNALADQARDESFLHRHAERIEAGDVGKPAEAREARLREDEMTVAANSPSTALGRAFLRDPNAAAVLWRLSHFQAAAERSLFRSLHEIQRLQAARNGEFVPAPTALDVDVFLRNEATEVLESTR